MSSLMFLAVRALHVGVAATWIGSTVFTSVMLMPAIEEAGAAGGQVMATIGRRGITQYMMVLGASTLVTGVYLLWRFTAGFDAPMILTHAGLAFAIGGGAGIVAGVIGGGVVGRGANRLTSLMSNAAHMPDGPAKGALFAQAAALRGRVKLAGRVVLALQAAALVLMAVGHYI